MRYLFNAIGKLLGSVASHLIEKNKEKIEETLLFALCRVRDGFVDNLNKLAHKVRNINLNKVCKWSTILIKLLVTIGLEHIVKSILLNLL